MIGTSLQVYPAAGLLDHVPSMVPKYLIDPQAAARYYVQNLTVIRKVATIGMQKFTSLVVLS